MFLLPLALMTLTGSMASSSEMLMGAAEPPHPSYHLSWPSWRPWAFSLREQRRRVPQRRLPLQGLREQQLRPQELREFRLERVPRRLPAAFSSSLGLLLGRFRRGLGGRVNRLVFVGHRSIILCRLSHWDCAAHQRSCAVPCGCGRWWRCAVHALAVRAGGGCLDNS